MGAVERRKSQKMQKPPSHQATNAATQRPGRGETVGRRLREKRAERGTVQRLLKGQSEGPVCRRCRSPRYPETRGGGGVLFPGISTQFRQKFEISRALGVHGT
ncbi:hypothetical protein J3458_001779 [Metarhizium acridum]|uniref:uncharacterized protein n=1 Tax=Metarhizium acridum TaxID=92637 RepID=UPI001C6A9EEF|nr:hypothetical protein J3458_001779 [Metarhizium acridum]